MASPEQFAFYTLLYLTVLGIGLYYFIYLKKCLRWAQSNIPFNPPIFGFGHKELTKFYKQSLAASFDNIYKQNSDKELVGFFVTTTPFIMIRDLDIAQKELVKNFACNYKLGFSAAADDSLLQNTLPFIAEYEHWRQTRALLAPHFSFSREAEKKCARMQRIIDKMVEDAGKFSSSGRPVPVRQFTKPYIFSASVLSLHGIAEDKLTGIYSEFVEISFLSMLRNFIFITLPQLQRFKILRMFRNKNRENVKLAVKQVIEDRIRNGDFENDFIDFLIEKLSEAAPSTGSDRPGLRENTISGKNVDWVSGLVLGSLLGTNEGVSNSLHFTMHLLSLHPKYQEMIKAEVEETMKKHQANELTYPVLQDLKFTEQCILESMRMFVSFPVIRQCVKDHQIQNTKYTMNKGDHIVISSHSIHMDPKYYPDPESFNPDRFSEENRKHLNPASYLPFGFGLRKCPGYQIGTMLVLTFVAGLVQKFKILPRSHKHRITPSEYNPLATYSTPKEPLVVDLQKWDD